MMTSKFNSKIIIFILGIFFISSSLCFSQDLFDYSKIIAHPRLLLNKESENKIHENLKTNPELLKIHNYIIDKSNDVFTKKEKDYWMFRVRHY